MVFPVVMYGCESWTVKKAEHQRINTFERTVVLEKTLESPLNCKEIQPVNRKGNQSWIFVGRTDAEAETPIIWPPNAKNWLTGKDPDSGKDWRQEEKADGWMASLTRWTWVWVSSRSWWWTGKPGVLQSMGLQRVRHDWATGLNFSYSHSSVTPWVSSLKSSVIYPFPHILQNVWSLFLFLLQFFPEFLKQRQQLFDCLKSQMCTSSSDHFLITDLITH